MGALSSCLAWANPLKQVLINELEQEFLQHPTYFLKFKYIKIKTIYCGEYIF